MNYEEMSDFEINKAVAINRGGYQGHVEHMEHGVKESDRDSHGIFYFERDYCNNPSDAWPIIVKNKIRISPVMHMSDDNGEYLCTGEWEAGTLWSDDGAFYNSKYNNASNENPLRAAMIVFLMMQE